MRSILTSCLLLFSITLGISQQDASIIIDGKTFPIKTNKEFTYITHNGDSVKFMVNSIDRPVQTTAPAKKNNPVSTAQMANRTSFTDDFVSFDYPVNYSAAKISIGPKIDQITLINGQGSGIIIQEFSTINPSSLVDFMLNEYKDNLSGVKAENQTIKTANGVKLKGKRIRSNGDDIAVVAHHKGKRGVLVTLIKTEGSDELMNAFLKTFEVK